MNRALMPTRRSAFTIVELLVVISIIAIVAASTLPFLAKMTEIGVGTGGQSTLSVAANAARILNLRLAEGDLPSANVPWLPASNGNYSGTIALFTQAGEIRFCINDQLAQSETSTVYLEPSNLNGYKDIEGTDYINLPFHARVAGVIRIGGSTEFYAPPFALRFNEQGHLVTDEPNIYYDGNYNRRYDTGSVRGTSYNPNATDPRVTTTFAKVATSVPGDYKYPLPFETIETVSVVILYDNRDFQQTGYDWSVSGDATNIATWLKENGTAVFFSPQTGLMLKE